MGASSPAAAAWSVMTCMAEEGDIYEAAWSCTVSCAVVCKAGPAEQASGKRYTWANCLWFAAADE